MGDDSTERVDLLPCPFCGGAMQLEFGIISHADMVEASCRDCPLKSYVAAQCQRNGWNTRAIDASMRAEILEDVQRVVMASVASETFACQRRVLAAIRSLSPPVHSVPE